MCPAEPCFKASKCWLYCIYKERAICNLHHPQYARSVRWVFLLQVRWSHSLKSGWWAQHERSFRVELVSGGWANRGTKDILIIFELLFIGLHELDDYKPCRPWKERTPNAQTPFDCSSFWFAIKSGLPELRGRYSNKHELCNIYFVLYMVKMINS